MKGIILVYVFFFSQYSYAWDGYDWDSGDDIEIEKGNLVRPGKDIDVFNYSKGEYKTYEVESVSGGEVEVFDYESGEFKTFDMD